MSERACEVCGSTDALTKVNGEDFCPFHVGDGFRRRIELIREAQRRAGGGR